MEEPDYIVFAKNILGVNELPFDLAERLYKINSYVIKANDDHPYHILRSSQVVAMVVEQWERET